MTDTNGAAADAVDVITGYFTDRVAEARGALAQAEARLEKAETEAAAFAQRRELPPEATVGWELAGWATERASRIGMDAITTKTRASNDAFTRARAEEQAVHAWLAEHGFEITRPGFSRRG